MLGALNSKGIAVAGRETHTSDGEGAHDSQVPEGQLPGCILNVSTPWTIPALDSFHMLPTRGKHKCNN